MTAELPEAPGPVPPSAEQEAELRRLLEGAVFTAGQGLHLRGHRVEAVVTFWESHDDEAAGVVRLRDHVVRAETATPANLTELVRLLLEGDPAQQEAAARAVGELGPAASTPEVLRALAPLVFADNWRVAAAAAETVDRLGEGDALQSYLRELVEPWVSLTGLLIGGATDALVCAFGQDGKRLRLDGWKLWARHPGNVWAVPHLAHTALPGVSQVRAVPHVAHPGQRGALSLRGLQVGSSYEMHVHTVTGDGILLYESANGKLRGAVRRESDRRAAVNFETNDGPLAGAVVRFFLLAPSGNVVTAGEVRLESDRAGRWAGTWSGRVEMAGSLELVFEVSEKAAVSPDQSVDTFTAGTSGDSFAALMGRLEEGDAEAAALVYERYARRLIGLAHRELTSRARGPVGPDDVVQSVFRTFFRRAAEHEFDLHGEDALWALLAEITLRRCGRWSRHFAARRPRAEEPELAGVGAASYEPGEDREPSPIEAAALTDLVGQFLRGLGEKEQLICEMRLQGYEVKEIAERTGVSTATVFRKLDLIKKRLRRLLPEDESLKQPADAADNPPGHSNEPGEQPPGR
jgi:RNA polymerase sigma-70 factor (ECF subfamily)